MEKKYNFVYLSTNLINRKQYIGDHSTDNLNDNYIGSGRPLFENAKQKYGKENFIKQILEFFPTKKEATEAQEKYIRLYKTHVSEGGYNISWTGGCWNGGCHSEESKKKNSESNKGKKRSTETKEKIRLSLIGRKHSDKTKQKISDAQKGKISPHKGVHMSEESKQKISLKNKGKQPRLGAILSENTKNKISVANKGKYIDNKFAFGLKHSKETKEIISKRMSGENNPMFGISPDKILCVHCNRLIDKRNYSRWHNDKCKSKL